MTDFRQIPACIISGPEQAVFPAGCLTCGVFLPSPEFRDTPPAVPLPHHFLSSCPPSTGSGPPPAPVGLTSPADWEPGRGVTDLQSAVPQCPIAHNQCSPVLSEFREKRDVKIAEGNLPAPRFNLFDKLHNLLVHRSRNAMLPGIVRNFWRADSDFAI